VKSPTGPLSTDHAHSLPLQSLNPYTTKIHYISGFWAHLFSSLVHIIRHIIQPSHITQPSHIIQPYHTAITHHTALSYSHHTSYSLHIYSISYSPQPSHTKLQMSFMSTHGAVMHRDSNLGVAHMSFGSWTRKLLAMADFPVPVGPTNSRGISCVV